MRFSSDQEFFQQNSKQQEKGQNQNQTPTKKKQKKQTMLSKFLDSIDQNTMKKLLNYQKQKRPIFERRNIVPQKITLYQDVLFITIFKENQEKILADGKQLKTILTDLQSRTKRKQCTIKERIQKKVCKMSPAELLDHITNDKDISFNLKKVLTSSSKVESSKNEIDQSAVKQQKNMIKNQQNKEKQMQTYLDLNQQQKDSKKSTPQKQDVIVAEKPEIFYQKDEEEKIIEQKDQKQAQEIQPAQQTDLGQIFIVFKKDSSQIFMINQMIIHKEISQLKRQEKQRQEREVLITQLKAQLEVIDMFRRSKSLVHPQIQALINQAEKITKALGIICNQPILSQNQSASFSQQSFDQIQEKNTQNAGQAQNQKIVPQTSDQNNQQNPTQMKAQISQFQIQQQKYTTQYSLCQNQYYLKLYKSDPQTFQPLLWTQDQDTLINTLIQDYKTNQKLFSLLIRYKGPQMFVQRCCYLKKNILESPLYEGLKSYKPLNLSKLNSSQVMGQKNMIVEEVMI